MTTQLISANHAAAQAATLAGRANRSARGFGCGVYPITPQTECIEYLCKQEFEKGAVVRVESEHSAMAVCIGAAFSGARSFTASASNGLAYMAENVYAAAFFRLPIVMMAVNRTLGPPWNIWVDHGDTLMLRDAGWIQFYCLDNQEVADTMLLAFRLSEHAEILLPSMVCQDAFVLSHTMMLTDLPDQPSVDAFLPTLKLPHQIGDTPVTQGGLDFPHETESHRREHHEAMLRVPGIYQQVQDEFQRHFGRRPADRVVAHQMDDAEVVLVSMGTTASTVNAVVDSAREKGLKVGALRIRMFRPFPEDLLRKWLRGRQYIAILDRDLSPGLGGILWSEIRGLTGDAIVQNYMIGLGGGDIRPEHIERLLHDLLACEESGSPKMMEVG
jgi:pyruvate/2-oxoacid:ferredoxin oxidoreductase alpha subunit